MWGREQHLLGGIIQKSPISPDDVIGTFDKRELKSVSRRRTDLL